MTERKDWLPRRPSAAVVTSPATREERTREQDQAAGGRANRLVRLAGGKAVHASIRLQMPPRQRRVWAYLHYRADGRNITRYVGEATADTRPEALRKAWQRAHAKELLNQSLGSPSPAPRDSRARG